MPSIKKLKKSIFLLLGIVLPYVSFSQENYIPGYIINHDKDTLKGFVDYRNWEINPNEIKFKTSIDALPISYRPVDISEFSVEEEAYVSGIVNTEISPYKLENIETDPQIKIKVDTTFLQAIFRGEKELYYYKTGNGKENLYIRQGQNFELLIYKKYLKQKDGKNVVVENKKYIGQLLLYLNDCPTIESKLHNTLYKQKSLYDLFQYYYECSKHNASFQHKTQKSNRIGIVIGTSLTSLKFKSDKFPYLVNTNYNESVDVTGGLFFDLVLPRNLGKWSIYNELLYTNYNARGTYEEFENENDHSTTYTEFSYSYLKINNLIRFKYQLGSTFLFFSTGISNGFAIHEKNYKKVESKYYSRETITEEPAIAESKKYEQSYIVGIGVSYNRFSIETRYERGNGMSVFKNLASTTNRGYFLFTYRFNN